MKPRHRRFAWIAAGVAVLGLAVALIDDPWCSVFHHCTEK